MIGDRKLSLGRLAAALLVTSAAAGCETYQSEKADLIRGGGESYRLQLARERLENAEATQLGLIEDHASAQEELAALQAEVNRNRASGEAKLTNASGRAAVSPDETARLRRQLNTQSEAFNDKVLEIETARSRGASSTVEQKRRELERLRQDLARTNQEIDILSQ